MNSPQKRRAEDESSLSRNSRHGLQYLRLPILCDSQKRLRLHDYPSGSAADHVLSHSLKHDEQAIWSAEQL